MATNSWKTISPPVSSSKREIFLCLFPPAIRQIFSVPPFHTESVWALEGFRFGGMRESSVQLFTSSVLAWPFVSKLQVPGVYICPQVSPNFFICFPHWFLLYSLTWHMRISLAFLQAQQGNLKGTFAQICLVSRCFEETGLFRTSSLSFSTKSKDFSPAAYLCIVLHTIYGFSCFVSICPGTFWVKYTSFSFTIKVDEYLQMYREMFIKWLFNDYFYLEIRNPTSRNRGFTE